MTKTPSTPGDEESAGVNSTATGISRAIVLEPTTAVDVGLVRKDVEIYARCDRPSI
jgi:hypothetical protein